MENKLKKIQEEINEFYIYDENVARKYMSLIEEAIETMRTIPAERNSMLETSKEDAIYELSNELTNRLNDSFFNSPIERQKSEFKISKMLVSVAIGNVLSDMNPQE